MTHVAQVAVDAPRARAKSLHRGKNIDDLRRRATEFVEDSENRLAVHSGQPGLVERYLDFKVCFAIRCVAGEFEQWGFVFQRLAAGDENFGSLSQSEQYEPARVRREGQKPFMLTNNVEFMERPKKIVPSLIRAERFENAYSSGRKPLFVFYPALGINEIAVVPKKWKVRIPAGRLAISLGKSGTEQIERRSERIDHRTDSGVEYNGHRALFAKYRKFLAGLMVEINNCDSDVRLSPSVKLINEEWELGFAPLDRAVRLS